MYHLDKENPLSAGLGVGLIAASFTVCLPVIFGIFIMVSFGGRFVIDYEFWVWPIAATAGFFGICTTILVACRNAYRQFSSRRRQPQRLLSPPPRA
jgi:hypothetical protein